MSCRTLFINPLATEDVVKYTFGILKTAKTPEARVHNLNWLGQQTLGIEVVLEPLATRCFLGNIDPQHQGAGGSSAIERAMVFELPPKDTKLVTIRPDKDSVGAMAVLELRAQGRNSEIDPFLVACVGALDRNGFTDESKVEIEQLQERKETTDAMNAIIHRDDLWPSMESKVIQFMRILTREMKSEEIEIVAKLRLQTKTGGNEYKVEHHGDKIAFIFAPGDYYLARDWGNRRFPVAIVFDPEHNTPSAGMHPRYTIVRKPQVFDRNRFEAVINAAEARARGVTVEQLVSAGTVWGGPRNIVSSPQGKGNETCLSKEIIIELVREHTESGLVS